MRALFRGLWPLLTVVLIAVAGASPVAAHTDLVGSAPKSGQTLSEPPGEITLRFGADLLSAGATVVAKDSSGAKVDVGPAVVAGREVTAPWPASADSGTYTVAWRAVADDGHPLEGTFTFTVQGSSPVPASPEVSPSQQPAPEPSGGGMNLWLPALFVVALAVVGLLVWRSRGD